MWYGILMALGMILGTIIALKEAKRVGISEDSVLDLAIIAIPMGLLGARYIMYYLIGIFILTTLHKYSILEEEVWQYMVH